MLILQILIYADRVSTPIRTSKFSWMIPDEIALYGTTFDLHLECVTPVVLEYDCHTLGTGWRDIRRFPSLEISLTGSRLSIGARCNTEFLDDVYFGVFP